MKRTKTEITKLLFSLLLFLGTFTAAIGQVTEQQAERIRAAVPDKATVTPKQPRRVLIWNTPFMEKSPHKGYSIPQAEYAMTMLGRQTGAYEPVVSDDVAVYLPENLKEFDAIVMNNSNGPWIRPTEKDMSKFSEFSGDIDAAEHFLRKSLLDWVRNGGGIVAYHHAIAGNTHWPEFQELLGAGYWGHPWNEEVGVELDEPDHPLLAAFEGKDFRLSEEIFQFREPYSREKLRVLLSLDTSTTNMGVSWIHREDNDFALAWVRQYGRGRVFYCAFGHRTEIWWNPKILKFYLDAIQFATGDLEALTAPRPDFRPVKSAPGPTSAEVRAAKMKARNVPSPTEQQIQQIERAAPNSAPSAPGKARKVLVWGHAWTHQPNPYAEAALEILGRKTGAFKAVVSDDPRLLLSDRLPKFDALVMNNIHERDPFLPEDFSQLTNQQKAAAQKFDEAVKQSILNYVRDGKGIVGIHAATAAFQNWPEYGRMMGGYYSTHIFQDVAIKLDDPRHPVNACFDGKPFQINDEIYIFREPYSRDNLHVLLSLDLDRMADPGKRPDKDYAVSWVNQYGQGRIFYTSLGHAAETYWNPLFLQHLLAGIQFAIGDLNP
jgi:type 1 glutamine amidotransferase